MSKQLEEFKAYRERMNQKILTSGHLGIKRFFNLDTKAYEDGALDVRTKELLGLVASTGRSAQRRWRATASYTCM